MVTKTPDCDNSDGKCRNVQKLKGKAFVLGHFSKTFINQVYRTYKFENISHICLNLEKKCHLVSKTASDKVKYLHSTYDERGLRIIHLLYETGVLSVCYIR